MHVHALARHPHRHGACAREAKLDRHAGRRCGHDAARPSPQAVPSLALVTLDSTLLCGVAAALYRAASGWRRSAAVLVLLLALYAALLLASEELLYWLVHHLQKVNDERRSTHVGMRVAASLLESVTQDSWAASLWHAVFYGADTRTSVWRIASLARCQQLLETATAARRLLQMLARHVLHLALLCIVRMAWWAVQPQWPTTAQKKTLSIT